MSKLQMMRLIASAKQEPTELIEKAKLLWPNGGKIYDAAIRASIEQKEFERNASLRFRLS